jgi:dTDP-L-rhamnose 4-epimerase
MMPAVLITGGAGFIGSFLADKLIEFKYPVTIFDNLTPQVHQHQKPKYLNSAARFVSGDVRNYRRFKEIVNGHEIIFHLAARVGVAQANYQVKQYVDTNIGGMANLLDILINHKSKVKKVILAASMTSYGEGIYKCPVHKVMKMHIRSEKMLSEKKWDFSCPKCTRLLSPLPTPEETIFENKGIYSLTKQTQEDLLFSVGKMYDIPCVSLRLFNVYGPRQSLSNPYTGVSAIFISRLRNNKQPIVFEDGNQTRDFISIHDVIEALVRVIQTDKADFQAINIGSGKPTSIANLAKLLAKIMDVAIQPEITNTGRKGDIRHCFADISKAKRLLGFTPTVSLEQGLEELVRWSKSESPDDLFDKALSELSSKRLLLSNKHC